MDNDLWLAKKEMVTWWPWQFYGNRWGYDVGFRLKLSLMLDWVLS